MGKLGKKARKFLKKNIQSVHKRQRKMKSTFKRKAPSHRKDAVAHSDKEVVEKPNERSSDGIKTDDPASVNFLDNIFTDDVTEDFSDTDGFLSEDSECPYMLEQENGNDRTELIGENKKIHMDIEEQKQKLDSLHEKMDSGCPYMLERENGNDHTELIGENKKIHMDIAEQKRKLDSLREKDPKFSEFLESHRAELEHSTKENYSDDEDGIDDQKGDVFSEGQLDKKILTSCTVDVWCWLVMEQPEGPALSNLLNGFRSACQYGIDSDESPRRIPNKEVFSKILTFVLCEADSIFRTRLGISDSCREETILKLTNSSKWEIVGPLMKSYLRSCLIFLNQVTDWQILVFVVSRLRASTVFLAAFPSLGERLIKVLTHLWVTGEESLSLSSFIMIRDIASRLSSDFLAKCLLVAYKAFVAYCKFVQPTTLNHLQFLSDSIIELYSLDIQKSYPTVLLSVQNLASTLRVALKSKKKEELKKIHNWQYVSCVSVWVKFVTCNTKDHDLRPLSTLLIEVISGIAHFFPGPRFLPLRFKCVQMLNKLSLASGIFIPVASFLFDCLENKVSSTADTKRGKPFNFAAALKVPKQLLKSRSFNEECIHSALELLLAHFSQWSYHISFPEVATIPLILLKRFHEMITLESLRRYVKRLIDQVEQNIEFIQRKRDEVGFSPNDHASVETFLQLEKSSNKASFTQYYSSILQKSQFNET